MTHEKGGKRTRKTEPPVHPAAEAPEAPLSAASGEPSAGSAPPAEPGPTAAPPLEEQLAAARREYDELFARYQRLAADFENHKRRTRQDLADRTQYASEQLIARLLPLLDNLQLALEHAPAEIDPAWFDGIRLIARQFEDTLGAQGVQPIRAVGEKFDPNLHEAVAREESEEHEEGTVVAELQRGYRLHDRVLRPTLVKIAEPRQLPSGE